MRFTHRLILSFIVLVELALCQPDSLKPLRVDTAPVLDGLLDDPVWTNAPRVSGFKTFIPDFGKTIVEQTEVSMIYDYENLYFAFRCYDGEREKIKTSISSRDNIMSDDFICINLDALGDQQGLYGLYVNPNGIQADSRFAAGREDFSLDLVWFSAGRIDSLGYTVEVQVPLKSIRFAESDPVVMGVVFERTISRRSEHSSYPELDPAKGMAFLTQMKPMVYTGVRHYTLWELLPAFTIGQRYVRQQDELIRDEQLKDFSITTKYGITSNLILDGTINPDFSQVEADAGQVDINLRSSLYYPEKRSFFLEGREHYSVAATEMSDDPTIDPLRSILHTRTIADPILGLKVSGKVGDRNMISTLYAVDEILEPDRDARGRYMHFPMVRFKRALSGDGYIGSMYAAQEFRDGYNRVFGLDEQLRLGDASIFESSGFISWARPNTSEPLKVGHTLGLRYSYGSRDLEYGLSFREISDEFRADMGYLTRTGIVAVTGLVRPKIFPEGGFFQRLDPELYNAQTLDRFSNTWETYNHAATQILFGGSYTLRVKYSYSTEIFQQQKFQTGGIQLTARGQFTKQLFASASYRRSRAIYYDSLYQGKSSRFSASMVYQPSDQLQVEGSFIFSDFVRDADDQKIYEYPIRRFKLTYQLNQYVFVRGVAEYNEYRKELLTDFLASFTYVPGSVIHLGYGSFYAGNNQLLEMQRAFFFKTSYLWRM